MGSKRKVIFGWILFAIILLIFMVQVVIWGIQLNTTSSLPVVDQDVVFLSITGVIFSIIAMLIITRLPDNRIGWLMMVSAVGAVNPASMIIASLPAPPSSLTMGLWLILWLNNWAWIPLIFPILLIPLHFPTGHPPSQRWNWVIWLAVGMGLFFILFVAFVTVTGPSTGEWTLPNPIGFIPDDGGTSPLWTVWLLGLGTIVLSSVFSLFVRYRRAGEVERQQIKWILYAAALFAVNYSLTGLVPDSSPLSDVLNALFVPSILAIPIAIVIAILRYRLYDIDLLIRRTLQYSMLTGLLALFYFGSVVLLQRLFSEVGGQPPPAIVVLSTLLIAALFNPLRRYLQNLIDRRFYRRKYDAELALAQFAITARDEVDQENLTAALVGVIQETVQPENASLWLIRRSEG
jgi:MFS family permease